MVHVGVKLTCTDYRLPAQCLSVTASDDKCSVKRFELTLFNWR